MSIEEALSLIDETNEPLATVLRQIISDQRQIKYSQEKVLEKLIDYLSGPDKTKMDFTFLAEIFKDSQDS